MHLADLLDHDTVRALAGPASFERGVGYLAEGRVGAITTSDDAIEATVEGGDPYAVRARATGSRPRSTSAASA